MKRLFLFLSLSLVLVFGLSGIYTPNNYVYAMEDSVGGNEESDGDSDGGLSEGKLSKDDQAVGDYIKSQRGMTGKQMAEAGKKLSPLTNIAGYIVGGIVVIIFAFVFVITALDLLYITIPPLRNVLYKAGTDGTGAMTGGMPGGGYGMRGGYGMHGGMMGGMAGGMAGTAKPTQWISDEAVQCAAMLGGSSQTTPVGGGMMGGMGAMGSMAGQMPQQMPMKSVIVEYFKRRVVFMIILAIAAIVLTSSVLLGTGVNLAEWITRMIDGLNNSIPK